ncbi:MAG: hypothetical protein GEV08_15665 [Acidimicrobiia bacterium]|nr:hypothetical protein [Acidimicrobiia bacterium]
MTWELSPRVDLATGRISSHDAARQARTAAEILRRLEGQPGLVLADEVGMGKTYVALAVAASVVEATGFERQVVVMVPPGVQRKWPQEWTVFRDVCLRGSGPEIRAAPVTANKGTDFLRLLDDPPERRNHIVFATHGALSRSLTDPWTQLALVQAAFERSPGLADQRRSFARWAPDIISREPALRDPRLVAALLDAEPMTWAGVVEKVAGRVLPDDPVPGALLEPLARLDTASLSAALAQLPLRDSRHRAAYVDAVRVQVREERELLWRAALARLDLRLPLLVLDEAHHVRNSWTQLARPFTDGDVANRGALAGAFERMLFLTATPFQLGHDELIRVLDRFDGARWEEESARATFARQRAQLKGALDRSQAAAVRLQSAWARLRPADVAGASRSWWASGSDAQPEGARQRVAEHVTETRDRFAEVQELLRPWVIRHLKAHRDTRRSARPGQQLLSDLRPPTGIEVGGEAVLPFLLAARAQGMVATSGDRAGAAARAFFAEGLCSSFEAYRRTRAAAGETLIEAEATGGGAPLELATSSEVAWYLTYIDKALPEADSGRWAAHPKVAATVARAVETWEQREKLLVFCFYVATGRALRTHISRAIHDRTVSLAAEALGLDPTEPAAVTKRLDDLADRFFHPDTSLTQTSRERLTELVSVPGLSDHERHELVAISLRFLRTPSFLVRYVDLREHDLTRAVMAALDPEPGSLGARIGQFAGYAASRIGDERANLLDALRSLETGVRTAGADDEGDGAREVRVPNVRLANGATDRNVRERLLLAFNSPFLPEVLIASSVMGEGVDLHQQCRHVIHHDGDWNPSVLEQRTGRVDRIGSLAERTGSPIVVYEPFLAGAQDEKQYRVVKDRDRWFNVVMGAPLELDEGATDRLAERVPLPTELAALLSLDLSLDEQGGTADDSCGPTPPETRAG